MACTNFLKGMGEKKRGGGGIERTFWLPRGHFYPQQGHRRHYRWASVQTRKAEVRNARNVWGYFCIRASAVTSRHKLKSKSYYLIIKHRKTSVIQTRLKELVHPFSLIHFILFKVFVWLTEEQSDRRRLHSVTMKSDCHRNLVVSHVCWRCAIFSHCQC